MQMLQCPNCGKLTGFKRALGFGTFFMVLLTCGLWLLAIPFYPARCINCGLTRGSAFAHNFATWYRGLSGGGKVFVLGVPAMLFLGIALFNFFQTSHTKQDPPITPAANFVYTGNATDASNDKPSAPPVVNSVADINARRNMIPTGTDLTVRGLYIQTLALGGSALPNQLDACSALLYSSGTVSVQHGEADPREYCKFMIRLQNEDTSRVSWVECNMNREDAHAALQQYGYNSLVLVHGVYASSLDFNVPSGFAGIPVLEDCSVKPLTTPIPPVHFQSTGTSDDSAASVQPSEKSNPGAYTAVATPTDEAASGNVYKEVAHDLDNWAKAYESNDATLIANCYADQVDRYFLRQNVTNTFVHDYMDAWLKNHDSRVIMFKIKNAAIYNQTPAYVQLRLTKDVVVTNSKGAAEHLTPSELSLKKVAGEWKITSERDFK